MSRANSVLTVSCTVLAASCAHTGVGGVAARVAILSLFALRHVGVAPHVQATPPDLLVTSQIAQLWTEPANLEARDLFTGPWGPEAAPRPEETYSFVAAKKRGFSPGYDVKAPDGTEWSVKMGPEAQTEVTASRILWAVGYHQPPVYYLPHWTLGGGPSPGVKGPGRFRRKTSALAAKGTWSWQQNPFVSTRPYRGLLVLMMMLNSTDLKNDNNTVYDLTKNREDARRWYVVRDLGATFGETGLFRPRRNYLEGFERQGFIDGVDHGYVRFEFHGLQRELVQHITPADVRWMCELVGRLSSDQLHDAFRAAGYSNDIADRYIAKLRRKIDAGVRLSPEAGR